MTYVGILVSRSCHMCRVLGHVRHFVPGPTMPTRQGELMIATPFSSPTASPDRPFEQLPGTRYLVECISEPPGCDSALAGIFYKYQSAELEIKLKHKNDFTSRSHQYQPQPIVVSSALGALDKCRSLTVHSHNYCVFEVHQDSERLWRGC